MGCCGKIDKVISITEGSIDLVLERINMLPVDRFIYSRFRVAACQKCQYCTHLTDAQYIEWIKANGGIVKFLKEIDKLDDWQPLPIIAKDNASDNTKMFCALCKCRIKAKASVKREKCPVAHPDWTKPKCFFKES